MADVEPRGYRVPPRAMVDLVDAPETPDVAVAPDRQWLLLMERPSLPPITELAQPELRLAGLRINRRTNGPSRATSYHRLALVRLADGVERAVTGLPEGARLDQVRWSPDASQVAFAVTEEAGLALWVADVATGRARQLTPPRLNGAYGAAFHWQADSRTLVCRLLPTDRGPAPRAPAAPDGPIMQETAGKVAPAWTFQDLLRNPHDEALFEHYLATQVAQVTLDGDVVALGQPGLVRRAGPSPDGQYLLVETVHRPYSYLVPVHRFPLRVEVWDRDGNLIREVVDLPLAEEVPVARDAVPAGPRAFGWRADAPAALYWTEARDGGDPRMEAEVRDQVYTLAAPFDGEPVPLLQLGLRFGGALWGNEQLALVRESWWKTRRTRTWLVEPGRPDAEPRLLFDRSFEDRYGDPGFPLLRPTPAGTWVLLTAGEGETLFLAGEGASPEGNRPFLDRLDLRTGTTERLWRSEAPSYERPVALLDEVGLRLLTCRESVSEPPNYFVRDLPQNALRQVTEFRHPAPQLRDVHKELIRYERADGVKLTATLYLPPGHAPEAGPLPMLMWAYPHEYKSADAAGQVTDSPYRFVRIDPGSPLFWLTQGYAILDDPTMPIVGEGDEEPNDAFVAQLVANAQAAVDEVVRRGVADRERVAIGGHSYGAFMTANLLAHSDLFCAGIARSGAYNRTLTPFGFQAEERTLWEAPEVYFTMSPYMHAQKIKKPLLLIHGEADNNAGTFPLQSERLYNALKGHGATARLVILPHESHGYRARESVLHVLWETTEWLESYVKRAPGEG